MTLKPGKLYCLSSVFCSDYPTLEAFLVWRNIGEVKPVFKGDVLLHTQAKKTRSIGTIFYFLDKDGDKVWLEGDEIKYFEEVK